MSRDTVKNVAASNRAKLLNLSRAEGRSYQELVQYFAMSRFLYRLAESNVASGFILKGAMLLHARNVARVRSTLDIDFLGCFQNDSDVLKDMIVKVMRQEVAEDGLAFFPESLHVDTITQDADYVGLRVQFKASLGSMQIPLQLDIGFGDEVEPPAEFVSTPCLLGYPAALLRGYTLETSVAEKVQVMFNRELLNSRMKDFYDVWLLVEQGILDQRRLVKALVSTFERRKTAFITNNEELFDRLARSEEKQLQWMAFRRKRGLERQAPEMFHDVVHVIGQYLCPVMENCRG